VKEVCGFGEQEVLGRMYLVGVGRLRSCLLPVGLGVVMKTFFDGMSFDVVEVLVYSDLICGGKMGGFAKKM
jgi:hypothetical protein